MGKTYKTEGVVIKRFNFGEADKILTVFTKHHGKVRAVAKGVRRLTSRKAGNVELFNQATLFFVRSKNLDLLTEAVLINSFSCLRANLKKVAVAYYFCEVVDKLTPDNQPQPDVYRLLVDCLVRLGEAASLAKLVREFEETILDQLGFGLPDSWRRQPGSLRPYLEQVTERPLTSPKILR